MKCCKSLLKSPLLLLFFSMKMYGGVVLSEINFQIPACADLCEYVEIYNTGPGTADISGWYITDLDVPAWTFTFPFGTTIAPGEFIIITRSIISFQSTFPGYTGQLYQIDNQSASLNNNGAEVCILTGSNVLVDSHPYTAGQNSSLTFDGTVWSAGQPASPGTSVYVPVELVQFKATEKNGTVLLEWKTASELDNDYFTVEYSMEGVNFSEIGKVAGAGTSFEPLSYRFTHSNPEKGTNYYRLIQVDVDGTESFSHIVTVSDDRKLQEMVSLWPAVAGNEINVRVSEAQEERGAFEIFDIRGIKYHEFNIEEGAFQKSLNISSLIPGIYMLRYTTGLGVVTKQFRKM